jgi:hypothetical protein
MHVLFQGLSVEPPLHLGPTGKAGTCKKVLSLDVSTARSMWTLLFVPIFDCNVLLGIVLNCRKVPNFVLSSVWYTVIKLNCEFQLEYIERSRYGIENSISLEAAFASQTFIKHPIIASKRD